MRHFKAIVVSLVIVQRTQLLLPPYQAASASMAKLPIGSVRTKRQFGMQKGSNKQRRQAKVQTRGTWSTTVYFYFSVKY